MLKNKHSQRILKYRTEVLKIVEGVLPWRFHRNWTRWDMAWAIKKHSESLRYGLIFDEGKAVRLPAPNDQGLMRYRSMIPSRIRVFHMLRLPDILAAHDASKLPPRFMTEYLEDYLVAETDIRLLVYGRLRVQLWIPENIATRDQLDEYEPVLHGKGRHIRIDTDDYIVSDPLEPEEYGPPDPKRFKKHQRREFKAILRSIIVHELMPVLDGLHAHQLELAFHRLVKETRFERKRLEEARLAQEREEQNRLENAWKEPWRKLRETLPRQRPLYNPADDLQRDQWITESQDDYRGLNMTDNSAVRTV